MSFGESPDGSANVQRMLQRISHFFTDEGFSRGKSFKPRSDDVFVVSSPKCGTTWLQQIVHQLRSGGDMSFDEISDVIPLIEVAYDTGIDLETEHKYQPRCYKSHLWYPDCPKGAKYIVIYREPCAACSSFFNFYKGWIFQPGEISLHEFVKDFLLVGTGVPTQERELASYFVHFLSWWEHRNDPNVLFLFYEDMKDDLDGVVRMVAAFIGIKDEERIKKAMEMSSFKFMKANARKFSEIRVASIWNKVSGIPENAVPCKVATGSPTKGRELMDDKTKEIIEAKWLEVIGPETGFQDYNELRSAFKKEKMNSN